MFLLVATCVALVYAALEIIFGSKKRKVLSSIGIVLKNIVVIDVLSIGVQRFVLHYQHFLDTSAYGTENYIKFAVVALIVGFIMQLFFAIFDKRLTIEPDVPKKKHLVRAAKIITIIIFFVGVAAYYGSNWGLETFGKVTGDQLLINLTSPTEGTEASVYLDGFEGPAFTSLLLTVIFAIIECTGFKLVYHFRKKDTVVFVDLAKRILCFLLACGVAYYGVSYGVEKYQLDAVFKSYFLKSDIIDSNYADPETTEIVFPEQKRNLIHIYLESMENSFMSKDLGGYMDENLIPNLTELAYTGTVFSNSDNYFGGPQQGLGTQWSIASMVNQMTGLPMKAPGWKNTYGTDGTFLPGAYTLAELLEREGYEQTVMFGASGNFGGLRYLFETHANWTLFDYNYAKANGYIPEDYKVWWGFEDDKLYEFAKEEITRLYETGKPFNFTMENADTHRPNGYITPGKEKPYDQPYANALWNSDRDVIEFINWIKEQPFYENTTIVLIGDHLSMDTRFFEDYNFTEDYFRTQYNCFINAPAELTANLDKSVTTNRIWANWDMFPTIVASLGCQIEGDRLGIGTNLFSGKPTMYEEMGYDYVESELEKKSELFTEKILEVDSQLEAASHKGR